MSGGGREYILFQLRPMKIVKHIKVTLIPVGTTLFYPKKYLKIV